MAVGEVVTQLPRTFEHRFGGAAITKPELLPEVVAGDHQVPLIGELQTVEKINLLIPLLTLLE